MAFDGEFYLPLGYLKETPQGAQIVLERLPQPLPLEDDGAKDIKSTIRIYFQKVAHEKLGRKYDYPRLSAAEMDAQGALQYEYDAEKIAARVAQVERISLFIHGFTGETRTMLPSARRYLPDELLRAFDYESLNTPIEENARKLRKRLQEVGLGARHGKHLRLLAHSMGGILARWLVEQVPDGRDMVQQVVILGSPSAGTPWPSVQQWATVSIGLALNGLSAAAWPLKALGWLLNAFETVDVALDQVQPNSDLLKALEDSDDPHVPYLLIAGNTSLILGAATEEDSPMGKLLRRLGYGLAALPFFGNPNDIAISVDSVHAVSDRREPKPVKQIIPCDHISYFDSEVGLQALGQATA